jgi:mono/diheme cytochrome c family protein
MTTINRTFAIVASLGLAVGAAFAIDAPAAADSTSSETPLVMSQKSKVGSLVNPYAISQAAHDPALAAEGHRLYSSFGCPGCHGGGGGGGMCPPLISGVWIYGDADDTLFRLVTLGTVDLQKQGFSRRGLQHIVAPMPSYGSIITNADDLWKIIAWIKIQTYNNLKNGDAAPPKSGSPWWGKEISEKGSGLIPLPSCLTAVEVDTPRLGSKYRLTVRFLEVPDPLSAKDIEIVEPASPQADPNFITFEIDPIAPKTATLLWDSGR